jgi:hypothetical protein
MNANSSSFKFNAPTNTTKKNNSNKGFLGNLLNTVKNAVTGNKAANKAANAANKAANVANKAANIAVKNAANAVVNATNAEVKAANATANANVAANATAAVANGQVVANPFLMPNGKKNMNKVVGGMAPVNFGYGPRMQQPSNAVMYWATTAGAPMPPESEMRNVAHGGKRRTHRKRRVHKRKSTHKRRSYGGKRHRATRRKTHRRRHHKRN